MGHHIRVNCGDCNRLFYCNGKDLTCAECKAYPSNTTRPKPKENEMNNLPDPYQPYGKDTATCARCLRLYDTRINPGRLTCEACADKKPPEIVRKTCDYCETTWTFIPDSDQSKCPHCKQPYDSTEIVNSERSYALKINKEDYRKTVDSLIKDIEVETNGLLAKAAENKFRLATLRILRETLK